MLKVIGTVMVNSNLVGLRLADLSKLSVPRVDIQDCPLTSAVKYAAKLGLSNADIKGTTANDIVLYDGDISDLPQYNVNGGLIYNNKLVVIAEARDGDKIMGYFIADKTKKMFPITPEEFKEWKTKYDIYNDNNVDIYDMSLKKMVNTEKDTALQGKSNSTPAPAPVQGTPVTTQNKSSAPVDKPLESSESDSTPKMSTDPTRGGLHRFGKDIVFNDGGVNPDALTEESFVEEFSEKKLSVTEKLSRAFGTLTTCRPFFRGVLEGLEKCPTYEIPTMGVTPTEIAYNPDFVKKMPVSQLVFVLIHEAYHILMQHHLRKSTRDALLWNYAGDLYINKCIADEFGIKPDNDVKVISATGAVATVNNSASLYISMPDWVLYSDKVKTGYNSMNDSEEFGDTVETIYDQLLEENPDIREQLEESMEESANSGQDPQDQGQSQNMPDDDEFNKGFNDGYNYGNEQNSSDSEGQQGQQGQQGQPGQQGQGQPGQQGQGQQGQGQQGQGQGQQGQQGQGQQGQQGQGQPGQQGQGQPGQGQGQPGKGQGQGTAQNGNNGQGQQGQGGSCGVDQKKINGNGGGFPDITYKGDKLGKYNKDSNNDGQGGGQGQGQGNGKGNVPGGFGGKGWTPDVIKKWPCTKTDSEIANDLRKAISRGREAANKAGFSLDGSMTGRLVKETDKRAPIEWRKLVRATLEKSRSTFHYTPTHPDRKGMAIGQTLSGKVYDQSKMTKVYFCIDTSGSVSDEDIGIIVRQITDFMKTFKDVSAHLIYWDAADIGGESYRHRKFKGAVNEKDCVHDLKGLRGWNEYVKNLRVVGGGGTNIDTVLRYIARKRDIYDERKGCLMSSAVQAAKECTLIIFTDGYFSMPDKSFSNFRNTVWIIKDNPRFEPPFGKGIAHVKTYGQN